MQLNVDGGKGVQRRRWRKNELHLDVQRRCTRSDHRRWWTGGCRVLVLNVHHPKLTCANNKLTTANISLRIERCWYHRAELHTADATDTQLRVTVSSTRHVDQLRWRSGNDDATVVILQRSYSTAPSSQRQQQHTGVAERPTFLCHCARCR